MSFKITEVDSLIENYNETENIEEISIPLGYDLVVIHKPFLEVHNDKDTFYVAEGTYFNKNEDDSFDADWSLTWVWLDKDHPEQWFYYEQDGILTTLHNLFHDKEDLINEWTFDFVV